MSIQPEKTNADDLLSIGQLASELGWSVRFIEGLVRAEQLPTIRSRGILNFRRRDVIEWLQHQIHHLDRSRVAQMEKRVESSLVADGTFRRSKASDRISSRLTEHAIFLDHLAAEKASILNALADLAASTGLVYDRSQLHEALVAREALGSTALPGGVAVCHPRQPWSNCVSASFICLIRTSGWIDFGSADGSATRLFFLLCAADERTHLFALARIARMLRSELIQQLLEANDSSSVKRFIANAEAETEV